MYVYNYVCIIIHIYIYIIFRHIIIYIYTQVYLPPPPPDSENDIFLKTLPLNVYLDILYSAEPDFFATLSDIHKVQVYICI
jgi:hypothetical protein